MADINKIKREIQWWDDELHTLERKLNHAKEELRKFKYDLIEAEQKERRNNSSNK
jgi:septal ring factor EnvC (AmiA/AmiB activator)